MLQGRYPRFTGRQLRGVINRTMTLREDSDIVARHGRVEARTQPRTEAELEAAFSQQPRRPGADFLPGGNSSSSPGKVPAPVVWFVSHCNDFNGRFKYVQWLQKHIGVDIFGECGPRTCGKTRNMGRRYSLHRDPCFRMVNKNYRFYLSFENAVCRDYVTEKVFNSLQLNTIPVLLGGANYTRLLPPGSFINAGDHATPEHLAAHLHALLRDDQLFSSYFSWRPHYDILSYASIPDNCELCEKLVSGELRHVTVVTTFI